MNDFVWVIIADESCEGGIIHEINPVGHNFIKQKKVVK